MTQVNAEEYQRLLRWKATIMNSGEAEIVTERFIQSNLMQTILQSWKDRVATLEEQIEGLQRELAQHK